MGRTATNPLPKFLDRIKPPETGRVKYSDATPGLFLIVSASGKKTWIVSSYARDGRKRSVTLGDLAQLSQREARIKAQETRLALRDGGDPTEERRQERAARKARAEAATLETLLTEYERHVISERVKEGKGRSWKEAQRAIRSVLAKHMNKPLADLTARDLQHTIDRWPSRSVAGSTVRFVRPILKWASKRHDLDRSVALELETPEGADRKRERELTDGEVKAIWNALDAIPAISPAFRWLFWTVCRKSEMTGMTWGEIDLVSGIWSLPAARSKNGRTHVVPLPQQALDVLDGLRGDHSANALVFPNRAGGELDNMDRLTKRIQTASKTSGWHRHDIRRTGATMLGNMRCPREIQRLVLNHTDQSVTGRYDISERLEERREWLQRLADRLDAITGGNVVTLQTGRQKEQA
ncbi:tyrosine-type recombinase/integrase [Kozakia baliensis]|uniref:tyrosine-type recombinase/integrase n=1 Tax=Kozakia baliensis TaxID=153496 RepID=UPI0004974A9B|nr:site-specific integrase [Kozakia baliensis]